MKEAGLRIRLESRLRDDFVAACRSDDLTAAQVIRAFMRSYVEKKNTGTQPDLFDFEYEEEAVLKIKKQQQKTIEGGQ